MTYEERQCFLDERNLTEGDVMCDDLGREYVYEMDEEGIKRKIYLEN